MDRRHFIKSTGLGIAAFSLNSCVIKKPKPNIIYILADDLGYNELGVYGQKKILTPNIDKLAKTGMKFNQHYSGAPVCAPARCVLLTGKHLGHSYVRGNDEWAERGDVWDFEKVVNDPGLEGQRPIPADTATISKLLQKAGYTTGCVGKWGLGAPGSEGVPNKQGFDFFYGYNCQRQAHTYYPKHLWNNEEKVWLNNKIVPPHSKFPKDADPNDEASYADFNLTDYAPDFMGEELLNFIDENKDNPFFMYYASPIPHLPLQAPKKYVDKYRKIFGEEKPFTKGSYFPNQYPRATYAGMITYLDDRVGDIVTKLKEHGIYEDTLIIFTSDNGPTYTGGVDFKYFESAKPFKSTYGYTKGFIHEGGIRVPMIANWPGKIKSGSETELISAFYDVFPTLCEVAGIPVPEDTDGISYLPTLLGKKQEEHEFLYWEFPEYQGQHAVRMGKWKALRKNMHKGNTHIELFDLENDIQETTDVSAQHPDVMKRIKQILKEQHVRSDIKRFQIKQLDD